MRSIAISLALLLALTTFGCASNTTGTTDTPDTAETAEWMEIELTDVRTGETFKLSDFNGTPVLLETFAVWCSTCKRQQDQIDALHEKVGDDVISVSIDIDPSENKQNVQDHVERYDFNWRFAIDTDDFAKMLVADFGVNVVNAPSAPIILIDAAGQPELLRFGVKNASELEETIAGS